MIDEIISRNTSYTVEEMKAAYEYGQDDCGEFGNIKGFSLENIKLCLTKMN